MVIEAIVVIVAIGVIVDIVEAAAGGIVVIVVIVIIVDIVEAALGGIAAAMERMANLNGG